MINNQYRKVLGVRKSPDYIVSSILDSYFRSKFPSEKIHCNIDLLAGYAFKSVWFSNEGMPLLRNINVKPQKIDWTDKVKLKKDLIAEYERFSLEVGDIVLSMDGSVSNDGVKIAVIKKEDLPCYLLQRVCRLHVKKKIIPEYLYWMLQTNRFIEYISDSNRSIAISHISAKQILNYSIPLPPIELQKEVVEFMEKYNGDISDEHLLGLLSKNLSTFYEKNNLISLSEQSINLIQKLRQAILSEAVQGKLVPQDPKDEPAIELLKKINTEKKKLIKEKKIKKEKPLPPISENEIPFKLPKGWVFVRLLDVSNIIMGQSPPGISYNDQGVGMPLINGPVEFTKDPLGKTIIRQYTNDPNKICKKGDLLVCVRGATTGRTNIASCDSCIGRGVAAIRAFLNQDYINWVMVSIGQDLLNLGRGSTFPSISQAHLKGKVIGFPPSNEQKRIVEKVDQLMKLCDELEEQVKENQKNSELLMNAVLKEASVST